MKKVQMVAVIATAIGHDGLIVRQPGEEFMVPVTMFDKRPHLYPAGHVNAGKPDGTFYDAPSWFKKKSPEREKAVRLREQARSARVVADAQPQDKAAAAKAEALEDQAEEAEKKADKAEEREDATDLA